jgi:transposase
MTSQDRHRLETWVRAGTTPQRLALRAQICLLAAEGVPVTEIADRVKTTRPTVLLWKRRFEEQGPDGLVKDASRGPSPRRLDDATREALVEATLNAPPTEGTQWTTRTLAKALGVSNATVARIWKACGIKPNRKKAGKRNKDKAVEKESSELAGIHQPPPAGTTADDRLRGLALGMYERTEGELESPLVQGNPEIWKAILETMRHLGSLITELPRHEAFDPKVIRAEEEGLMNWRQKLESWFAAAAFAEEGEYATAVEIASTPVPQVREEAAAVLPFLTKAFAAVSFAEENCHEIASEMLYGTVRSNSFLETVGLAKARVWYATAGIEESFAEAVGLGGVRLRVLTIKV